MVYRRAARARAAPPAGRSCCRPIAGALAVPAHAQPWCLAKVRVTLEDAPGSLLRNLSQELCHDSPYHRLARRHPASLQAARYNNALFAYKQAPSKLPAAISGGRTQPKPSRPPHKHPPPS